MELLARAPTQIGAVLRRYRDRAGHSQAEPGRLPGLRQATISQIENGNGATRIESICSILAALGLDFTVRSRSQGRIGDLQDLP